MPRRVPQESVLRGTSSSRRWYVAAARFGSRVLRDLRPCLNLESVLVPSHYRPCQPAAVDRPEVRAGPRVNAYTWLKLVHVLAAITAVGANLTYFYWLTMVPRSSEHSAYVLSGIRRLDARVANPAYVILPITGILTVLDVSSASPRSGSLQPSFCT